MLLGALGPDPLGRLRRRWNKPGKTPDSVPVLLDVPNQFELMFTGCQDLIHKAAWRNKVGCVANARLDPFRLASLRVAADIIAGDRGEMAGSAAI